MKKTLPTSRRQFLKSGSLFFLSKMVFNDPAIKVLAESLGFDSASLINQSFTCEIFRPDDLLHLKYFFFNAKIKGNKIKRAGDELYVYIKLPAQHVSEELVKIDPKKREDLTIRKSFLSQSSWLAFKLSKANEHVKYNAEDLLNWEEHFDLITIDDFALDLKTNRADYQTALKKLKDEFSVAPIEDKPILHSPRNGNDQIIPLTTFQVPYKIVISPIAPPFNATKADFRSIGAHVFIATNSLKIQYANKEEKSKNITIVSLWENTMMFRNQLNELSAPRFKALRAFCPQGKDVGVELLPAPMNREEIKELTSLYEHDRDISSEFFHISSLGASTNLKYRNDDPTDKFALIAWEQRIKYSRDLYISVTYRAIDVFTGLKLRVSIVSDRSFKYGTSYMPKLYHVAYAEKEKIYNEDPVVVSHIPFVKIIPKNDGAFFYPHTFDPVLGAPNPLDGSYIVGKSYGLPIFNGKQINAENLVDFEYVGIDKNNVEHSFKSKMVFIAAEKYVITDGVFNYTDLVDGSPKTVAKNGTVKIPDIGTLNPALEDRLQNAPRPDCVPDPSEKYKFKLEKTFAKEIVGPGQKTKLEKLLAELEKQLSIYRDCFAIAILRDVTFAKIVELKGKVIAIDSTNSTFSTKDVLLSPTYNENLNGKDFFFNDFPIVPALSNAFVKISQIDQMRGRSEYYGVRYFEDYKTSNKELDSLQADNKAKLFFELIKPIDNFFTENYKGAGAAANPGIKITHVSALDNSIGYNQTHNSSSVRSSKKMGFDVVSNVSAASVFRELKAEVLGISLISIINDSLPVNDIPFFKFAKQIEQTIARIEELEREFSAIANGWKGKYQDLLQQIESTKKEIEEATQTLKDLQKNSPKAWLDTLVELSGTREFYNQQVLALKVAKNEYDAYIRDNLSTIKGELDNIKNLDAKFKAIVDTDIVSSVKLLINEVVTFNATTTKKITEQYVKEAAKVYYINWLKTSSLPLKLEQVYEGVLKVAEQYEGAALQIHQAFSEGIKEALVFSITIAEEAQQNVYVKLDAAIHTAPVLINALLKEATNGIIDCEEVKRWVLNIYKLAHLFDQYHQLYKSLHRDYYEQLRTELKLDLEVHQAAVKAIEKKLLAQLSSVATSYKVDHHIPSTYQQVLNAYHILADQLINLQEDAFENIESTENKVKAAVDQLLKSYENLAGKLYSDFNVAVENLNKARALLKNLEAQAQQFLANQLQDIIADLKRKRDELLKPIADLQKYKKLLAEVELISRFLKRIDELSRQTLNYDFVTKKFKKANLGGVIEFIPEASKTELRIAVKYEVQLNIGSLNGPPSIGKQSFSTDSRFSNFKLGMLQLLYVDFEEVRFLTGSDVKDDFTVRIRNVEFAGFLSFFQAFQDYLKSLSDNFVFDINATGVRIGYGITIPDITSGAFNIFNLSLSGILTLPFQPNKSLQIEFGIGNDLNKFGLTVMGIFGGQGYFTLIAEPRRGIVGMRVVLEFGAIFHLDLVVAKGTAYLVGGIYIERYGGKFEMRAYILCVGRLRIIALFSASVTFYLGLHGDGSLLTGVCEVTVSYNISPLFEISVSFQMEKTLAGTESKDEGETRYIPYESLDNPGDIEILDTNLYKEFFYTGEQIYITVVKTKGDPLPEAIDHVQKLKIQKTSSGDISQFIYDLSGKASIGSHDIHIKMGNKELKRKITVYDPESAECELNVKGANTVNARNYYASYYS